MSQFHTALIIRGIPEGDKELFQLVEPLVYESDIMGKIVTVPADFITDFVSFKPLNFTAHRPSVIHDFLYCCKDVDRKTGDMVLREAMLITGASKVLSNAVYAAVRIFGSSHKAETYLLDGTTLTLKGRRSQ